MSGGGAGPLVPTFHGFVHNSMDGLILFEACLSGKLHHVPRRPHDRERSSLIKSGSIFIYEENASGIKRWTDGVAWSPSRILGNFLIYRELEKPFPPGEKKRAMKRKRSSAPGEPYPRRESEVTEHELPTPISPPIQEAGADGKSSDASGADADKELERSLIGSLVDSYGFRPDGLVKKTMSVSINGISHHMVSYYKVEDVKANLLPRPNQDQRLASLTIRPDLYCKQNFRAPVDEADQYALDGQMNPHPSVMYNSMQGGPFGVRPGTYNFGQAQYGTGMYNMPATTTAAVYGGSLTGTSWQPQQTSANASPYTPHPSYNNAGPGYAPAYYPAKSADQATPTTIPKVEGSSSTTQAIPYGGQYATSYPGMQRSGSVSTTPSLIQSHYTTPVPSASSTFGSMSSASTRHQSYSGPSMSSPPTNGQNHSMYSTAPSQQYPVRSPPSNYGVQSTPQSTIAQSPHTSIKGSHPAHQNTAAQSLNHDPNSHLHHSHMSYRSQSYAAPSGHSANDMAGLGISNASAYTPQPPQAQSAHSYGYNPGAQSFRAVSEATVQSAGNYVS
jgi:hypothetical protein